MLRILSLIFILLFVQHNLSAAHIVGGDVTYKCISSNPITKTTKFTVTFTLYRDVAGNGAPFDINASFGIYESAINANVWTHKQTIMSNPINIQTVPYDDNCVIVPPSILIEKANYIFDIELPWSDKVYQITFQRCCRNATISNIINPAETGAAFSVEIFGNAIEECNNSPVFNNFPPILVCNQKNLNFNHSATDSEGDRLEYEFCAPLQAGGTDGATTPGSPLSCTGVTPLPENCLPPYDLVVYDPNFSALNPMGGSPQISIDPVTGIISGVPNLLGQFVVGVCVKEYKNGVLIGSIRRDFQFNVVNCQGISITKNYQLCDGDSIDINQTIYNQAGSYTQVFQNEEGCDSTLNINIKKLENSESQLYFRLCDEETNAVNNANYNASGIYTQLLTNKVGCDSTITITIEKFNKTESNIQIQLCDEETGIVNDVVYTETGNYTQVLTNSNGCDSIINIVVQKGRSSIEEKVYSLCDQNPIVVNGQSYHQPGIFVTQFTTAAGCDSILTVEILPCEQNVFYDFEKCDALIPANSMVYSEFTPSYVNTLDCGKITAQNIYREDPQVNKHSCTPGFNNSIAMCVSASASCNFDEVNFTPIVIDFVMLPDNGRKIKFNHLIFQQKAPLGFDWIDGPKGLNNYPTKYAIKVYKDDVEIFSQQDIQTSNDWRKEKFDFFENDVFSSIDSANIRIELTPYCQIGNEAVVSVWDVDDVALVFSCQDVNNRTISGKIVNHTNNLQNIEIRRQLGHTQITTNAAGDGTFFIPKNKVDETYVFTAYHNENTLHGLTTLDLLITQRHILGIETFANPLQYLAADVNNDQKVTALDLVHMRKIILGIETHYRDNTSWIFLDEASMKVETNPWLIKKYISIPEGHQNLDDLRFVALKVGDVDRALQVSY